LRLICSGPCVGLLVPLADLDSSFDPGSEPGFEEFSARNLRSLGFIVPGLRGLPNPINTRLLLGLGVGTGTVVVVDTELKKMFEELQKTVEQENLKNRNLITQLQHTVDNSAAQLKAQEKKQSQLESELSRLRETMDSGLRELKVQVENASSIASSSSSSSSSTTSTSTSAPSSLTSSTSATPPPDPADWKALLEQEHQTREQQFFDVRTRLDDMNRKIEKLKRAVELNETQVASGRSILKHTGRDLTK